MAYVILISKEPKTTKILYKNLTLSSAKIIANRLNYLNEQAAKAMGDTIKFTYKVLGK